LGIGDWAIPNPQSPIPNPQTPDNKYSNLSINNRSNNLSVLTNNI